MSLIRIPKRPVPKKSPTIKLAAPPQIAAVAQVGVAAVGASLVQVSPMVRAKPPLTSQQRLTISSKRHAKRRLGCGCSG